MLCVLLGGCLRLHFNCDSEVQAVGTGSTSNIYKCGVYGIALLTYNRTFVAPTAVIRSIRFVYLGVVHILRNQPRGGFEMITLV